jgi:hypothetical protein
MDTSPYADVAGLEKSHVRVPCATTQPSRVGTTRTAQRLSAALTMLA